MNRLLILALILFFLSPICARADSLWSYAPWANSPFHSEDPLAARDEFGPLHQSPSLNRTDFDRRYSCRVDYYFHSCRSLSSDPAYVGALQTALRRLSYYCGPIDGVFSDEVSDAIAHMQKNYSQHVTGTLTVPVRRALHLP